MDALNTPRKRGFALMDPERQREIAQLGGLTAQKEGRAHRFTSQEAREAGKKSALAKQAKKAAG